MNRPTGSTWFIWHDMTWIHSCCQFWMDGVETILYSSSWVPDNVTVCNAAHVKCQNWMIHQLQKLVILSSPKPVAYWRIIPRTGKSPHVQATGKVNRDRLVAYWRIIPRTGKLSHVQATKQKWSACGLQTGEWFHAREMISQCCKPQGRFQQIDSLTTDPDWKLLQVSSSPPFFWCVVPAHAWQVGFHHAVWSNQSKQLRPEDGNMVLECCR